MSGRGRLHRLSLALLLLVAGCQAPAARAPHSSPSPPAERRLQAADARLYAGDYDGAEADYRAMATAGQPGAASHLSTLLAYENRFQDAITQARAGVEAHADSDSLARLTRALDWSQQVAEAVATGARAVAARPVQPLAHVFYSEALADAGRFDAAARELRTAEGLGGDAYLRAEIDREWANYYRGQQDEQSDLNYTELAAKEQPSFPERQLDLVRYDYANQKVDAARAVVDKLMAAHPRQYRLLLAAADAALLGSDGDRASSLYSAAAQARPDSAEAAVGQAEIAVAVRRDFNGAHDLLLRALQSNPSSGGVYQYLRYLDLLLLRKDPDAELKPLAQQPPPEVAGARKAAMDRVNGYRSTLGLPPVQEDPAIVEGAQAHAYYFLFNLGQPQVQGLGIHDEDPSLPGFVGANASERDRHFGFQGARSGEVIDHAFTPLAAVDVWVDSVFHRYPLLDRETALAGYGEARIGAVTVSVLDLGLNPPAASEAVVYPAPDQADVQPAFVSPELPDPLPQGAIQPAGYPVTLQVGGAQRLAVKSARLLGPDGQEVLSYFLNPGNPVAASQWALVPQQPLKPGARYTAEVTGQVDGQDYSKRWSFTVGGP